MPTTRSKSKSGDKVPTKSDESPGSHPAQHPQLPHPPPPLPTPPPPPPPPPSFGYPLLFQVACDAKLLGVTTSLLVNGQMVDANVCVIGHTVYLGIYIGK